MQRRVLGRTGLEVSVIGFGAGPVPALMTGPDANAQKHVLARALEVGINWFDTAAGYGEGQSESSLGRALDELGATPHVATKVRLTIADLDDVQGAVLRSLKASLARLRLPGVTLLQLHNAITPARGDVATSLTPDDVLRSGGVRDALRAMRDLGLTRYIGLTGTGTPDALGTVIDSGAFDTIQIPHHLLAPADEGVLRRCQTQGMGVFAIRVFAAGALLDRPPSAHTLKTPYFPLALYEDDRRRAATLAASLADGATMAERALRFALSHDAVHVALLGLSAPAEVDEAASGAT